VLNHWFPSVLSVEADIDSKCDRQSREDVENRFRHALLILCLKQTVQTSQEIACFSFALHRETVSELSVVRAL
jgi:hypothetical protein